MDEELNCKICQAKSGFCKHTIADEYKELCPETPITSEGIGYLIRDLAITRTEKRNVWNYSQQEISELKSELRKLRTVYYELLAFKKHMLDILIKKE